MHNSKIYIQVASIAQGGCSSSMLAGLFLYYYKSNYINISLHLYRYIDDIISTDNITCSIPVAHPSYLKLTENTLKNNIINYLDLKLILKNHKIYTDTYDKQNDFLFNVNSFTNFNFTFFCL